MKKAAVAFIAASLITTPVQAADWSDVQPGTFVGARLTIGGQSHGRPVAALAIAPTQSRISGDGMVNTRIGEGIALNFTSDTKPTLTLAGVRADTALGLTSGPTSDHGPKLGMSDGAKVAIGVGAAVLIGLGVTYAVLANRCTECDQ